MAECIAQLALNFHPTSPITVAFDAPHISSDGGALLLRQMDDRLGLSERVATLLPDARDPRKVKHDRREQVRQRLYQAWRGAGAGGGAATARQARSPGRAGYPRGGQHKGQRGGFEPTKAAASTSLKQSAMVGGNGIAPPYREALLLKTLLNHPWLIEQDAEPIAALAIVSPALARLRDALRQDGAQRVGFLGDGFENQTMG